ncbi:MAG: hypothetical protein GEU81_13340 [Nitriliruptorales bacterium]|nr:hypothetical protein [Nitriliruptorales bacterium]
MTEASAVAVPEDEFRADQGIGDYIAIAVALHRIVQRAMGSPLTTYESSAVEVNGSSVLDLAVHPE